MFFKSALLKSVPLTAYYDVHLLQLGDGFERLKRLKAEHQELRGFGYGQGEIFSYQLTGFTIEVHFMESGLVHRIDSIFYLFLSGV